MSSYYQDLKDYLEFSEEDQRFLRAFCPIAEPYFPAITDDFYKRVRKVPSAARVFRSKAQLLRLQMTLQRWMTQLLSGPWGEEYFQARAKIGHIHVKIGLPQHHMFSAMSVVQQHLLDIATERLDGLACPGTRAAINKITSIDLAIMLETYRMDTVAEAQSAERRERIVVEDQLQRSDSLYKSVFGNSAVAIVILDAENRIQHRNERARQLTETEEASLEALLGDSWPDMERSLARVRATQESSRLRTSLQEGNEERRIEWSISPIADSPELCLLGLDVTREEQLAVGARRNETLAALGALAAGLAHEIRNPLNAAQLQLMLVQRMVGKAGAAVHSQALESAELVRAELTRLAGLVEDFLAFARPGRLRIANTDLSDLCEDMASFVMSEAEEQGVEIKCEIEEGIIARMDGERIKQILFNLLRNGFEAAGSGGKVGLYLRREEQEVVLEICDSGPGVPAGIALFEPFATSKEHGTGLGLPIVHRIVGDHGGDISHSRREDHTCFTVRLPIDGPEAGGFDSA